LSLKRRQKKQQANALLMEAADYAKENDG